MATFTFPCTGARSYEAFKPSDFVGAQRISGVFWRLTTVSKATEQLTHDIRAVNKRCAEAKTHLNERDIEFLLKFYTSAEWHLNSVFLRAYSDLLRFLKPADFTAKVRAFKDESEKTPHQFKPTVGEFVRTVKFVIDETDGALMELEQSLLEHPNINKAKMAAVAKDGIPDDHPRILAYACILNIPTSNATWKDRGPGFIKEIPNEIAKWRPLSPVSPKFLDDYELEEFEIGDGLPRVVFFCIGVMAMRGIKRHAHEELIVSSSSALWDRYFPEFNSVRHTARENSLGYPIMTRWRQAQGTARQRDETRKARLRNTLSARPDWARMTAEEQRQAVHDAARQEASRAIEPIVRDMSRHVAQPFRLLPSGQLIPRHLCMLCQMTTAYGLNAEMHFENLPNKGNEFKSFNLRAGFPYSCAEVRAYTMCNRD